MPHLDYHPAPGISALLPGWTLMPYNPISPSTDLVASLGAAMPGRAIRIPRIGDLFATSGYPLPQNPILAALSKSGGAGDLTPAMFPEPYNPIAGMRGLGCSQCGMGDAVTDNVSAWLAEPSPVSSISNLLFWGGAAVAVFLFSEYKGSKYSYARKH